MFARGFLHNKAEWEDAILPSEKARLPFYPDFVLPSTAALHKRATLVAPGLSTDNKVNLVLSPFNAQKPLGEERASVNTVSPAAVLDWIVALVLPGLDSG